MRISPQRATTLVPRRLAGGGTPIATESARATAGAQAVVLGVYTLTMFVSAALLFAVQPMFAKMALPLLGGSPAVWNTAVVFYQAVLLGGYLYAHASTRWLGVRRGAMLHAAIILVPLLVLPIALPGGWSPPSEGNPVPWLLALLAVSVGLPFFAVSATSPLLQAWFARTGHRAAADPYFLYAASNIGSMLALIAYPLVLEPRLRLGEQSWLWATGYGLLVALMLGCMAALWRSRASASETTAGHGADEAAVAASESVSAGRRVRWLLLAFVPSALMLSVMSYFQNHIAPIPLVWVVPLGLYLLTFILVFANRRLLPQWVMVRALPLTLLPLVMLMITGTTGPLWLLLAYNLATFFVAAMVCHGALADDRPEAGRLTEFYLIMSIGGALGGIFVTLIAPVLFDSVFEYVLILVLLCLVMPSRAGAAAPSDPGRARALDFALPVALALLAAALIRGAEAAGLAGPIARIVMFGIPVIVCFSFSKRPARLALGVFALFIVAGLTTAPAERILHSERTFFGIHHVIEDAAGTYHGIVHGTTLHGKQSLDPARRREPLTYYTQDGPIGQMFAALGGRAQNVAVVGLGAGTLGCYSDGGQGWTFYEIDPAVVRIARDPRYFTYLQDCAPDAAMVLGDARLTIQQAPPAAYDVIVLDAFSSDSVPVHLLTREALAIYREKLKDGGVIAFHISNLYINLRPVIAALAEDAGMVAVAQTDRELTLEDLERGKSPSRWALVARSEDDLSAITANPRWEPISPERGVSLWTDDFSSIVPLLLRR